MNEGGWVTVEYFNNASQSISCFVLFVCIFTFSALIDVFSFVYISFTRFMPRIITELVDKGQSCTGFKVFVYSVQIFS